MPKDTVPSGEVDKTDSVRRSTGKFCPNLQARNAQELKKKKERYWATSCLAGMTWVNAKFIKPLGLTMLSLSKFLALSRKEPRRCYAEGPSLIWRGRQTRPCICRVYGKSLPAVSEFRHIKPALCHIPPCGEDWVNISLLKLRVCQNSACQPHYLRVQTNSDDAMSTVESRLGS